MPDHSGANATIKTELMPSIRMLRQRDYNKRLGLLPAKRSAPAVSISAFAIMQANDFTAVAHQHRLHEL